MKVPAERRVLLACSHVTLSPEDLSELRSALGWPLSWRVILELSSLHRLSALLAKHLSRDEFGEQVPEAPRRHLQGLYQANALKYLRYKAETLRALGALRAEGIPVILLKGMALAERVYGDPGLRPMGDIDLLVREEDLDRAYALVLGLGYAPRTSEKMEKAGKDTFRHCPRLSNRDGTVFVEVHRHVLRRDVPFFFDISGFWQGARTFSLGGVDTLVLGPEDLLTHLCLGFFLDSRSRYPSRKALARLVDIAETLKQFAGELDWESFVDSLSRRRLRGPTAWSLLTTRQLLNTAPPQDALSRICGDLLSQDQIDLFIERRVFREVPWLFHELLDPPDHSRWPGLKAAARRLFPTPSQLEMTYLRPSGSVPWTRLYSWHTRQVWTSCAPYLARPSRLWEDLKVYRWLYHTYAGT